MRRVHLGAGKIHKMITRALKPPVFGMSFSDLRWLKTVSSTFQVVDFDGS